MAMASGTTAGDNMAEACVTACGKKCAPFVYSDFAFTSDASRKQLIKGTKQNPKLLAHSFAFAFPYTKSVDKCPCWFSCRARCQVPTTLAVIKVQGDGDCLFHALAFCSGSDGGALRIEVADFLEEEALNQAGFEEAWLEEADKIRRSEWGGHTVIAAYSLMTKRRVIVHAREMDGGTKVEEQSHEQLMEKPGAKQIHILYNGNDHYDALVQVVDPSGMEPAWPQPPPPTYFKQAEEAFPSLHEATSIDNKKRPDRQPGLPRKQKPRRPKSQLQFLKSTWAKAMMKPTWRCH